MKVFRIEAVGGDLDTGRRHQRLRKQEAFWIFILGSLTPGGLNEDPEIHKKSIKLRLGYAYIGGLFSDSIGKSKCQTVIHFIVWLYTYNIRPPSMSYLCMRSYLPIWTCWFPCWFPCQPLVVWEYQHVTPCNPHSFGGDVSPWGIFLPTTTQHYLTAFMGISSGRSLPHILG